MLDYIIALVPPIGLLIILVVIVRAFLGADRAEREAEKKFRAEHPELDLAGQSLEWRRQPGANGPDAVTPPATPSGTGRTPTSGTAPGAGPTDRTTHASDSGTDRATNGT